MPELWVSNCFMLIASASLGFISGKKRLSLSVNESLFFSANCKIAIAVNCLVSEAILKLVDEEIFSFELLFHLAQWQWKRREDHLHRQTSATNPPFLYYS